MVAFTAPRPAVSTVAKTILDDALATVFAEGGSMQSGALGAGDGSSEGAASVVAPSLTNATLVEDAVECPTPSGLHFKWHPTALRNISLGELLRLASAASGRAEVRRLRCVAGAGDDLARQC